MGTALEAIFSFPFWGFIGLVLVLISQVIVAARVIMSRRSVGETLAWIMLVLAIPVLGWVLYLLVGELRLGSYRAKKIQQLAL